jgi:hypothetical protein
VLDDIPDAAWDAIVRSVRNEFAMQTAILELPEVDGEVFEHCIAATVQGLVEAGLL